MVLCISSVIDHAQRQNVVQVYKKVAHEVIALILVCLYLVKQKKWFKVKN